MGLAMDILLNLGVAFVAAACGAYAWFENIGQEKAARIMKAVDHAVAELEAEKAAWLDAERRFHRARFAAMSEPSAVRVSRVVQVAKPIRYETYQQLWLDVCVGDSVSVFKCDGCDRISTRDDPGYVKVCDGLEFCSTDCCEQPQPFPALPIKPERRREIHALN
jgi:hypothetical protein